MLYIPPASSTDDALLLAIQAGICSAQSQVITRFDGLIRSMVAKLCPYRASRRRDFVDDVAGETYRLIIDPSISRFDPTRGTAAKYLYGLVANAVRTVTNQCRPLSTEPDSDREAVVSCREQHQVFTNTLGQKVQRSAGDEIEREELIAIACKGSPARLADLALAHFGTGKTLVSLAIEFDTNRFQLARELAAFKSQAQRRLALAGAA
jgi:hypothetical protein